MKQILVLVLILGLAYAVEHGNTDAQKKRMAAIGPKDLDLKRMQGKWFELASSAAIAKEFAKGCECGTIDIKEKSDHQLEVRAGCRNATSDKYSYVQGIMTQVKPKENRSLFHLQFTEAKGIPHVKTTGKSSDVNKDESSKEGGGAGAKNVESNKDVNTVILKVDKDYKHLLFGSPQLDSAFIISKERKIDDNLFNEYVKFLEQNGFTATRLKKVDQSKCHGSESPKGKVSNA